MIRRMMRMGISIHSLRMEGDTMRLYASSMETPFQSTPSAWRETSVLYSRSPNLEFQSTPSAWRETRTHTSLTRSRCHFNPLPPHGGRRSGSPAPNVLVFPFQSTPSAWRETAKLHRKAFFISPILVQSCKKGCKRLHSAPEKMVFFEKREKNLVRNLQHLSVRL